MRLFSFLIIISSFGISFCNCQNSQDLNAKVIINDYVLNDQDVHNLKGKYGIKPVSGRYWYDTQTGGFGNQNGPLLGVMYPGHHFGKLKVDASNGHSMVFVNNRELQYDEATLLARLFGYYKPIPGKYWMRANGNIGFDGSYLPFGNVYLAISIQNKSRGKSSDNFWSKGLYSNGNYYTGANGQPSVGYVSVPGYGPISHGM